MLTPFTYDGGTIGDNHRHGGRRRRGRTVERTTLPSGPGYGGGKQYEQSQRLLNVS
jgi:hypothetical protein